MTSNQSTMLRPNSSKPSTRARKSGHRRALLVAGTAIAGSTALALTLPVSPSYSSGLLSKAALASVSTRAVDPAGSGYWLVSAAGQVYAFGNAVNYGGMSGQYLAKPIVGIVSTPDGGAAGTVTAPDGAGSGVLIASQPGLTGGSLTSNPASIPGAGGFAAGVAGGGFVIITSL